jgi:hypothetical protein
VAAVAELEAGLIGERTQVGLIFWRTPSLTPRCLAAAKAARAFASDQYAPVIRELQRDGYSMRGMAGELEKRKVSTLQSSPP